MGNKTVIISILIACCVYVYGQNDTLLSNTTDTNDKLPSTTTDTNDKLPSTTTDTNDKLPSTTTDTNDKLSSNTTDTTISPTETMLDIASYQERLDKQAKDFEKAVRGFIRGAVKKLLPTLMSYNSGSPMSTKCMGSLMKYISGLTSVKVWAIRMLDATSKPPSGIFEGTLSDFGGFDQCLEIEVPKRNGELEFRGQYCAVEARPMLPPIPKNFSMAKHHFAKPLDSLAEEVKIAGMAFYFVKFRLGVCIPSMCTLEDMQSVAKQISTQLKWDIEIPQCYVKENVMLKPVHIAVIAVVSLLLLMCIIGSVVEYRSKKILTEGKRLGKGQAVLICFSAISNYRRLICASQGSEEMKVLHGIRALSIAYVVLGHTYVWQNFHLLRKPITLVVWFNSIDFGAILNGWMSVEPFFILSGILTSYAAMKMLPKTKGRINVPLYILRRYIRLTPGLLLVMGLAFFMPLISSGPFWYERVEVELNSCTKYWWRNILYISNWFGMSNICIHPTWYLSADFQLHVITVIFLFIMYRSPKLAFSLIASFILACSVMVAALTYLWELPPIILIASGKDKEIEETIDVVHMNTFTHAGPYYVGIIAGYLIYKYKTIKMSKAVVTCGWLLSALLCLTSLYGAHRWNIGEPHGPLLTAIYAALHRTTYSIGVAWVAFACVTGYGGLVNRFLSSGMLAPISRLTFLIYLIHSLVIWVRKSSIRERQFQSHYNLLYEYVANLFVAIIISIPFYLLLEAPLSNLERLAFSRAKSTQDESPKQNGHHQANETTKPSENGDRLHAYDATMIPVELRSVKHVENGCNNLGFTDDLHFQKNHRK